MSSETWYGMSAKVVLRVTRRSCGVLGQGRMRGGPAAGARVVGRRRQGAQQRLPADGRQSPGDHPPEGADGQQAVAEVAEGGQQHLAQPGQHLPDHLREASSGGAAALAATGCSDRRSRAWQASSAQAGRASSSQPARSEARLAAGGTDTPRSISAADGALSRSGAPGRSCLAPSGLLEACCCKDDGFYGRCSCLAGALRCRLNSL